MAHVPAPHAAAVATAAALRLQSSYTIAPPLRAEIESLRAELAGVEPIPTFEEAVAFALRGRGRRRRPAVGWDALTPAELGVAKLAAQGLTSPQIGEKLFISRRTAQNHMSKVFMKLGVKTRAELAAEATRHGL